MFSTSSIVAAPMLDSLREECALVHVAGAVQAEYGLTFGTLQSVEVREAPVMLRARATDEEREPMAGDGLADVAGEPPATHGVEYVGLQIGPVRETFLALVATGACAAMQRHVDVEYHVDVGEP